MADPDPKPPKSSEAPTLVADLSQRPQLPGLPPDLPKPAPSQEQSSLALLAKDLMPPPAPAQPTIPEVQAVPGRKVPGPGLAVTVRNWARRHGGTLRDLVNKNRMPAIAITGTLLVVVVIAIVLVTSGGGPAKSPGTKLAEQGAELLNGGNVKAAAELLESELVGKPTADHATAYLVLGHARFSMKRYLEALTAYERALTLSPKLASDAVLRANATKILETKDTVAAVVAIELLASRVTPPAHDVVINHASSGKLADVRRRAFAIAEREGIADKVDRVTSWSLDLQAAGTCEDRRALIAKLASTGDRRALPALKRAKLYKCAEQDAAEAMVQIEGGTSGSAN